MTTQKLDPVAVPEAVRELLNRPWLETDAEFWWSYHRPMDLRSGQCYEYCPSKLADGFTSFLAPEVRTLVKAGAIPVGLVVDRGKERVALNQHAGHSLQQFLNECGTAYARHLERMRRWAPLCDESAMIAERDAQARVSAANGRGSRG